MKKLMIGLVGLMITSSAIAFNYTRTSSLVNTNWSQLAGWRDNNGGWSASTVFPGSGDTVIMNNGYSVFVDTNATIAGLNLVNNAFDATVNVNTASKTLTTTTLNVGHATQTGIGTLNLTAGTLIANGGTMINSTGLLDMNGGTLTFNTVGDNDIVVGGDGLLKIQSGTLNDTATAATDVLTLNSYLEISGGSIDLGGGQYKVGGEFKVIGDAATINIKRLNQGGGDYVFELDSDGISTIANGSAGYINLGDVSITVDGSSYTGGTGVFTLFDASFGGSGLNGTSTVVNVTGFAGGLSGFITQDQGTDLVTLTVIPEPAVLGLVVIFGGGMLVLKRRFS